MRKLGGELSLDEFGVLTTRARGRVVEAFNLKDY